MKCCTYIHLEDIKSRHEPLRPPPHTPFLHRTQLLVNMLFACSSENTNDRSVQSITPLASNPISYQRWGLLSFTDEVRDKRERVRRELHFSALCTALGVLTQSDAEWDLHFTVFTWRCWCLCLYQIFDVVHFKLLHMHNLPKQRENRRVTSI